jgi:hypothetical protein
VKTLFIISTLFLSLNIFANVSLSLTPGLSFYEAGEVLDRNSSRTPMNKTGDIYGKGINLKLGAAYQGFQLGFDMNHMDFGTRSSANYSGNVLDKNTYTVRAFGPYIGYRFMDFQAQATIFLEGGDVSDSDNESFEVDEGFKISLSYFLKENLSIGAEFFTLESSVYSYSSETYVFLDIEKAFGLNVSFPFSWDVFDI